MKSGDIEMLQDLVIAAVNEASRKVDEALKSSLGGMFGGMGLPARLMVSCPRGKSRLDTVQIRRAHGSTD